MTESASRAIWNAAVSRIGKCTAVTDRYWQSSLPGPEVVEKRKQNTYQISNLAGSARLVAIANNEQTSCFWVNGTDAPHKDPDTGIVTKTRHDRKLKVHEMLQSEVRSLELAGLLSEVQRAGRRQETAVVCPWH